MADCCDRWLALPRPPLVAAAAVAMAQQLLPASLSPLAAVEAAAAVLLPSTRLQPVPLA